MAGDRSGAVQLRRVSLTTPPDGFGEWDTQTQRRRGRAQIQPAAEGRSDMQAVTLGRGQSGKGPGVAWDEWVQGNRKTLLDRLAWQEAEER